MIEDITKATEEEIQDEMKEVNDLYESIQTELQKKWDEMAPFVAQSQENMGLLHDRYEELDKELKKRKSK